ncbi:mucin-17-like [Patiria miniata]|uniref:Uncharacterized protein n=1 Tax=Patiria miniata TaxID=46514 RepID=A0A913ZLR4_PATMI|nr:mucin-17-like [Patiria miniata]
MCSSNWILEPPVHTTQDASSRPSRLLKAESSTTVQLGQQDRPRRIIPKQDEFDLASVLFAPLNTPALSSSSSSTRKKRDRKQPPGRSQSLHEIGTRSREIEKPVRDLNTGKRVTFKEKITEIRDAVADRNRSPAADVSDDMSLRSSSSQISEAAKISSRETPNHEFQGSWFEKTEDIDRQMEGSVSDDQDDEKNLIIDESPTTQQPSDDTDTGVNVFKRVETFPDKTTWGYKTDLEWKAKEQGEKAKSESSLQAADSENPENSSNIPLQTIPVSTAQTSEQTSSVIASLSVITDYSTSKPTPSTQEQHEHPSLMTNGPASASVGCRSTSVLPEPGSGQVGIKDEQKLVEEKLSRPVVTAANNTTPIPQPPGNQQPIYTANSKTHPAYQFIASGAITNRLLSPSYFQRRSTSATQSSCSHDVATHPCPTSCFPQRMVSPQASASIEDKPQILFFPGNTQATLPRQGACGPVVWSTSTAPHYHQCVTPILGGRYQTPTTLPTQYQPIMLPQYHQALPNRNVPGITGHQVTQPRWQGQRCQAVRFVQPSTVVPGNYQPIRYVIYKATVTGTSVSSSQQAASSKHVPANLQAPVRVPTPVQEMVAAPLGQQQSPRPLHHRDPPPPPPPPRPSTIPSKQSPPPPPPPPATQKQSPWEKATPQQTPFGGHPTISKPSSRPSPASVIPNGTLFVQTPKGLVQLPRQHGGDRKPSPSISSQQYKLLPKPTDGKTAGLNKQIQGRIHLASVPKGCLPPRHGKDVPLQSVRHPPHTQASRALTVKMKPDQTTGIRLPFQMLSQKQLVHLTSKSTSQHQKIQEKESGPGSSKAVTHNKSQNDHQSDKLVVSNKQNASKEVSEKYPEVKSIDCEKRLKVGIAKAATSLEENAKDTDKHKTSKTKSNDKESSPCSQSKKCAGSGPKGRYVKFLDSSVTVNCIYVPKTLHSSAERKDVDSQKTSREQETCPASPSKTASLENMDNSDLPMGEKDFDIVEALSKLSSNDSDTQSEDTTSSHGDDYKTRSDDEDDKKDEWRPSVPVKIPSKCTRRFRNALTGGLSKINIRTSSRRSSGEARPSEEKEDCATKISKGHNDETSATIAVFKHNDFRTGRTSFKHQTCITSKLSSLEDTKVNFGTQWKEANIENQGSPAFRRVEDDDSLSSRPSSSSSCKNKTPPKTEPLKQVPNTLSRKEKSKKNKVDEDHSTNGQINKDFPVSKANSPSKRHHLRSSKSQSSDSDTVHVLSKYSKRVSFGDSDSSGSPENISKERMSYQEARRNMRRRQDRGHQSYHAPLWQKVLRMLGLKKKRKPVREGPPGGTPWHKRRSSSVVLAESLAESAKHLERNKESKNDTEEEKPLINEAVSSPATKTPQKKCQTPKKGKQNKDKDLDVAPAQKKGKHKAAKKKPKRRKLEKKSKVSPQSLTDPASGSLTSIDFDARRQTRSRARRKEDSASVSSYSQVDSSPSSPITRGRKTLASISAQTWEDCYRCTYLKWKEAEISPEKLAIDEGFKVMTNELGTPRGGPSKDKSFQKLLMSTWEDIVQSAQTGSLGEFESVTIKTEPQVQTGDESIFVDTPPVAAEFSVCTSDPVEPLLHQGIQTDDTWITDTKFSTDANNLKLEDSIAPQDDIQTKQVAEDTPATYPNPTLSSEYNSHQQEFLVDSYGMPPVLSPFQDVTEEPISQAEQSAEMFDTLEDAKAAGFIIPEELTEEMLRLLAEDGSIDPDLTGVQAFALFMPNMDDEDDQCDDRGSLSGLSQSNENGESDDDNEVPPVISCHRLDKFSDMHGDTTNEDEVRGIHVSSTLEGKRSIPITDGSELAGFVDKQLKATTELVQEAVCETHATSASQEDCCLVMDAMAGADAHHGNTTNDAALSSTFPHEVDSLNVSLEEGEIIDDESSEATGERHVKVTSDNT